MTEQGTTNHRGGLEILSLANDILTLGDQPHVALWRESNINRGVPRGRYVRQAGKKET